MTETFILIVIEGTKGNSTCTASFKNYYPHDVSLYKLNNWIAEQEKEFANVTGCTSYNISSLQFIQK